jgi:hypothetical protein
MPDREAKWIESGSRILKFFLKWNDKVDDSDELLS